MNSLKKPETIITLVNTAALLGISIYFYRKTNNLESELNKHSEHLTSTIKKVKEIANTKKYIAQIANAIKELNNYSAVYSRDIENLKEIIKFQNQQIQELHSFVLTLRPEDNKTDFKLKENPHIFTINPFHRGFTQVSMNQNPQPQMQPQMQGQMNLPQMNQPQMTQMQQPQQMRQLPNPQQFPGNQFAPPSPQPLQQQMGQQNGHFAQQMPQTFPQQMQQSQQFPQQPQQFPQQMGQNGHFPQQMNQQFPSQMGQQMGQMGQQMFPQNMNFGFPQQSFGNQNQSLFPGLDGNIENEDDAIAAVQRAKQQQASDNNLDNLF